MAKPEPYFVGIDIGSSKVGVLIGQRDDKSLPDIPFLYPRNFMGVGVVLRNVKEAVEGLPHLA